MGGLGRSGPILVLLVAQAARGGPCGEDVIDVLQNEVAGALRIVALLVQEHVVFGEIVPDIGDHRQPDRRLGGRLPESGAPERMIDDALGLVSRNARGEDPQSTLEGLLSVHDLYGDGRTDGRMRIVVLDHDVLVFEIEERSDGRIQM